MIEESERELLLENEWFVVRHSGEIPEITLHGSLYHLISDPEGPGLLLTETENRYLQDAAIARSREIVLRDLEPDNRELPIYRGIRRSIINYRRHLNFLARLQRDDSRFTKTVRDKLEFFLLQEINEMNSVKKKSLDCTREELLDFMKEVGLNKSKVDGWHNLCCPD